MIRCRVTGDFTKTTNFLQRIRKLDFDSTLKKYAEEGVAALSSATPVDTGKTAASWDYVINKSDAGVSILWTNSNIVNGVQVAVVVDYGHTTPSGGYVRGRRYISPAIRPIFDKIAEAVWKEATGN